jgi:hypothetical protein
MIGAVIILIPFALSQTGRLDLLTVRYQLLNALGSGTLTAVALVDQEWGFAMLEGTWMIVSFIGLGRVLSSRKTAG